MFAQPRFEVRYREKNDWQEISEIEIMDGLYKIYKRVTPAIKEMIKGKEVQTPDGLFRLKFSPES